MLNLKQKDGTALGTEKADSETGRQSVRHGEGRVLSKKMTQYRARKRLECSRGGQKSYFKK